MGISTQAGVIKFLTNNGYERMRIANNGHVGIGTNDPKCKLHIIGAGCIANNNPYAVVNNRMQGGSLTIGDMDLSYGGGNNWTANTAGLMMECQNDTEIVIHDAGNRLASFMYFQGGGTNKFTIGRNMGWGTISTVEIKGNLSIGAGTPSYPLHVFGSASGTYPSRSRLSWDGNASYYNGLDTSTTGDISIKSELSIWTAGYLIYSSDIRIKNNIIDIDDDMALQKILLIQPKTYEYIDKSRGNNKVYGFIAQQIKEVIPEAITITKETIPNIFKTCECNNDEIILSNDIISSNLNINDKIDVIDMENQRKQYTITDILDNKIKLNENLISSNCFIYGKEVNDFHTLDKTYIFSLNVCATQELYILIQQQNTIIQDLQNQINELKHHN